MSVDIQIMMQQAKAMQQKMEELQVQLADVEVEGAAGGGMVKVVMTCKGELRNVEIDPSVILPEDKEMLEDLVKAAVNDARNRADEKLASETRRMMEEMGLPTNMQMPF